MKEKKQSYIDSQMQLAMFEFYKKHERDYYLDKIIYDYIQTISEELGFENSTLTSLKLVKDIDKVFGLSFIEIGTRRERYAILIK